MSDPIRTAIFAEKNVDQHRDQLVHLRLTRKPPQQVEFLRPLLIELPMFADVNDQQLERLIGATELVKLAPREVIVRNGAVNNFMIIVAAGQISITKPGARPGQEEHVGPGKVFAQEALARSAPADFTAVAGGGCAIFRLHRTAFKLLQMDFGARFRAAIGAVMGQRHSQEQAGMSAMQLIVMQAMQKKAEERRRNEAHREFADVSAAIAACASVASLGKGAFGEVSLVVHQPTKVAYALKQQSSDQEKRAIIDNEISAMRAGATPFLVRFYGEHDEPALGSSFSRMLLEYMGGGTLSDVMAARGILVTQSGTRKGFDLPIARFYFACALTAIEGMHAAGWMHRDVKLENVVVDCYGYAKLIDCGLAKAVAEDSHTFTMTGTPCYCKPRARHTY